MPEKRIIITLNDDGTIKAQTDGFKGESCLEALEALLGTDAQLTQLNTTDEFSQHVENRNSQQQKNSRQ
jgi:hypothetical protein